MDSQQITDLQIAANSSSLMQIDPAPPSLKDRPIDWIKQNPIPTAIVGLLLAGLATGGGETASETASKRDAIQDFNDQAEFAIKHQEQQAQLRAEQFRLAVQRQQMGCIRLTIDGKNTSANIVEGMQVLDPSSGTPLAAGTFVCDQYGGTAVLNQNGQMTEIMHGLPDPGITIQSQSQAKQPIEIKKEVRIYAPTTN